MWSPASALRGGRPIAVLRVADQRADRSPTVCVRSGRPTAFAARTEAAELPGALWWDVAVGHVLTMLLARLLRRPRAEVVLAVDEPMWRQWRARLTFAVVVAAGGAGVALVGAVVGTGALIGLGLVVLVVGWLLRVRALVQCWVSLDLDVGRGVIRVVRAHPAFDAGARELFGRPVDRRR
jgi:hypothetical protein